MADPTIQIPSCRGDGRCPVEYPAHAATYCMDMPCGCKVHDTICATEHLKDLLTEALRQRDTFAEAQKRDLNESVEIAHDLQCKLDDVRKERDRARAVAEQYEGDFTTVKYEFGTRIKEVEEERDAAIRERDSARGVVDDLRESLDRQEEEIAALTRERDEARATKDMHKERQEDLEITVQIERERAELAEALLREAMAVLVRFESCLGAADMEEMAPGSQPLLAKIREVLT